MQHLELPKDYAIVLQTVYENGEEDFTNLAETLKFDRKRLAHIIEALKHKGLISFSRSSRQDVWIHLSSKGRKFMATLWPESRPLYGY